MPSILKLRRGTTIQHSTFTGSEGELTADTIKDCVVLHDGITAGGFPVAMESDVISITDLKAEVAASTDFADFQARIAAL